MTSMVAKASSSSVTMQEKGSRNKRKFRAEPPLGDPSKTVAVLQSDCSSYEFSADKFEIPASSSSSSSSCHGQANACDLCSASVKLDLGLSREEELRDDFHDADWSDLTESQLEELVLSNLDTIFKSAIKKIIACGYTEELAKKAVLRSGLCYGNKDTVSNIVDNTLNFLQSNQDYDPLRDHFFDDMKQLQKYVLAELVCVLREVRPFFSVGDAMWCLLISDMNVSHACAIDGNGNGDDEVLSNFIAEHSSNKNSSDSNLPDNSKQVPETSSAKTKETNSAPETTDSKPFSSEEKLGSSSRRAHSTSTKREYMLRQKSLHLDKTYRTYASKGSSRSGKLSSLLMDKKLKAVSENTTAMNLKNVSLKLVKSPPAQEQPKIDTPKLEAQNPPADTELSLGRWVPRDKKDEMILTQLAPKLKELQAQMQGWTEWANQKVMQAARRLGKEKEELKTLKQEKEEVERLKREKQALEENTVKKLSEMESALCKAGGQVERANSTVRRLEVENAVLRREMEAARLRAEESAVSCREVSKREKRTLAEFQAWEKRKSFLQEELGVEKRKLSLLLIELGQAKALQEQFEARWHHEEKANEDILAQANTMRKERERIEISTKSKENMIKLKAENNLLKYKNDIHKLEKEITKLRLKRDSPKIAALRRGIVDGSYASKLGDHKRSFDQKKSKSSPESDRNPRGSLDSGEVRRERECVMCLSEEMSVVFLPCAHQVVCLNCNELHEKQGMKDCPSCRSVIQRRISVRYARS